MENFLPWACDMIHEKNCVSHCLPPLCKTRIFPVQRPLRTQGPSFSKAKVFLVAFDLPCITGMYWETALSHYKVHLYHPAGRSFFHDQEEDCCLIHQYSISRNNLSQKSRCHTLALRRKRKSSGSGVRAHAPGPPLTLWVLCMITQLPCISGFSFKNIYLTDFIGWSWKPYETAPLKKNL